MENTNRDSTYRFRIFIAQLILFIITIPLTYITRENGRGFAMIIYIAWVLLYFVNQFKYDNEFNNNLSKISDYGNKYLLLISGLWFSIMLFINVNGMFPYETKDEILISNEYLLAGIFYNALIGVIIITNFVFDLLKLNESDKQNGIKIITLVVLFMISTLSVMIIRSTNIFIYLVMTLFLLLAILIIIYKGLSKKQEINQIYNKLFFLVITTLLIVGIGINLSELYALYSI